MKGSLLFVVLFSIFAINVCSATVSVRMIHALPNAPNVNVFFNGVLLFEDLDFKAVTQYRDIQEGVYNIKVVQERNGRVVYEIDEMEIRELEEHVTIIAHGTVDTFDDYPFALTKLVDDNDPKNDHARFRAYHCAAGVEDINVNITPGGQIFTDLDYTELSDYANVDEGSYAVSITSLSGEFLIAPTTLPFDDSTIVNLYFAGSADASVDSVTMIVAIDIETGIRDPESSNSGSVLTFSFFAALAALIAII